MVLDHKAFQKSSENITEGNKSRPVRRLRSETYYDSMDEDSSDYEYEGYSSDDVELDAMPIYYDHKVIPETTKQAAIYDGRMAEDSTGCSMKEFLDSIPASRYTQLTQNTSGVEISTPIEFASLAGFSLYFRETLQLDQDFVRKWNQYKQKSLLTLALGLSPKDSDHVASRHLTITEGLEISQLLLDNGYKDPEAFGRLISFLAMSPSDDKSRRQSIDIVIHFLETGHDPNMSLTIYILSERGHKRTTLTCTALHLAPPEIVPSLLIHGADPNSKDSEGKTPLERLCCNVSPLTKTQIYLHGNHARSVPDSYQVACMLLNGGAKLPPPSDLPWGRLLSLFAEKGYDVEPLQP